MYKSIELFGTPSRVIMDPVHGAIEFFEHESLIIDHPLFQRLRHIVQNDVLFNVFPGAKHTRFQHSLGTMHVSGLFFKSMMRSYLLELRKGADNGISDEQKEAIKYFYVCLRLAGLLHDIGHSPFSHQFENSEKIKDILTKDNFLKICKENEHQIYFKKYFHSSSKNLKIEHEHFSILIAHKILYELKESIPVDPVDVLSIMEKSESEPSETFKSHAVSFLPLFFRTGFNMEDLQVTSELKKLFKNIISGELDVDKMDYLLRDSYFSGCKYGIYNLDHLLTTLRIGFDPSQKKLFLAIITKGLGALEDFVNSRFQSYIQLYNHKTVVGFRWLLKEAINEVLSDKKNLKIVENCLTNIDNFKNLTDTFFWQAFRQKSVDESSFSYRLINRKKIKYLKTVQDISPYVENKIIKELETKFKNVISWTSPIKFSKIKGTYESMMLLEKDILKGTRELIDIKGKSDFFNKFTDIEIKHFYET
ncbi:MAG TPA: phosphohydrolase [Bacteroidales bacterium]|nr:phosphohydrolase [Bacteroidales bacterium]